MATVLTALIGVAVVCLLGFGLSGRASSWGPTDRDALLHRIERRRDTLLRIVRDIAFERELGLLSEAEFTALRATWQARLDEATRMLGRLRRARLHAVVDGKGGVSSATRRRIEDLVAARKALLAAARVDATGDGCNPAAGVRDTGGGGPAVGPSRHGGGD